MLERLDWALSGKIQDTAYDETMDTAITERLNRETKTLVAKIGKQSEKLCFYMEELANSSYVEREMIGIHQEQVMISEIVDMACQMQELAAIKRK